MKKIKFFIGPCVLESDELAMQIAESLSNDLAHLTDKIELIFKGSFDKANRTSIKSFRGPGLDKGLKILSRVKEKFGLPLVTDFHQSSQAEVVASVVDVLQVPAFLCRQTDLLLAGANACKKYNKTLKIKKGQFLAPWDTENIVTKVNTVLDKKNILLTERGICFGYNNLIVDMSSFMTMKKFGVDVIYDATHSVQMPGGLGSQTGGKRDQIYVLAKAAVAAGADGIFIETHPTPEKALSDSSTCLPLDKIKTLVEQLLKIYEAL